MGYTRKTATYKACEQASMYGLPISRTSQHTAKYTRKWKAARSWWDPEQVTKRKIRKINVLKNQ